MTTGPRPEDLLRELAPQVLGVVARRFGDFAAAEDAVQEALLTAHRHWPADGVPDNPRGWLIQAAVRKMIDHVRSEQARRRREELATRREPDGSGDADPSEGDEVSDRDDTLTLLFLCCHPALTPPSAVALTLRAVGGLTTAEIARAFLVPEATMAQRISRAKQRITASGEPFRQPGGEAWAGRLGSVLHVLYLVFNEGYTASAGADLHRTDLSAEAIRLARALHRLLPDDGQVTGLLALMLLTDARRPARTGPSGELVPLAEQDRGLWDRRLIAEGVPLAVEAMERGPVGEYQLQAAIAALHDGAPSAEATDWRQIVALYAVLERMSGNPMVALNRAAATAMADGPAAGLALLGPLEDRLAGNHRLDAVRGHLLDMLGDAAGAAAAYRSAAERTTSLPERHYLTAKAATAAAGTSELRS